ncbi:DNA polymerase III subunit chi [Candidatus Venteria ishoeyi]|uniref:DNA polymerase III subunit chi n=1 Tax=Candidatus Venteria ishoeyi TaxID=1899563 RepID=A0A1H6FGT8_9GAMM|nr:DNA polymerase III subunit chi [Candidatus Venteria ishoeyi]MDM8545115.1 DNA polymerase III subunit chi [Candidatus Venteria ishoeyi]SEH08651.1 DNA polymerase III subunit chi [Candidatus Venteria ishoeyi]
MPRIDFYLLRSAKFRKREAFVCALCQKIWQKHRVYIHTENAARSHQLGDLLWFFRDDSFLPHVVLPSPLANKTPVCIGHQTQTVQDLRPVLINLTPQVPAFFEQFERIVEVVTLDEPARSQGRERYRTYQQAGYPPEALTEV